MIGRRHQSQCEQILCPSYPPISSLLFICARDSERFLSKAGLFFFPVLSFACFFHIVLKKRKVKLVLWDCSLFSILARITENTVIMVSNKGHSIASSKITTYFSVTKMRPGKNQLSLIEEKLTSAQTISRAPGLQRQPIRSKTRGGISFPLVPSPMGSAHYSKSNGCSLPLSLAKSFVHPNSNYPLNWSSGVQVLQISTNCNEVVFWVNSMWARKGRRGGQAQMRGRVLAGLQNCRKLLVSLKLKMGEVCIKKEL